MNWRDASKSSTPDWFRDAIGVASQRRCVTIDKCEVHYRTWGSQDKPGLLLVHGMNAHSHWWDFIVPAFCHDYYVVALDFTGMGDSDYRHKYSFPLFAQEIIGVIEDSGIRSTNVVAHSFGAKISLLAANLRPDLINTLILLDSPVRRPEDEFRRFSPHMRGASLFQDRAAAVRKFRLQPRQPCANTYILEYIAKHSVFQIDGGWTWKFDIDIRESLNKTERPPAGSDLFKQLSCKVGVIYGEQSAFFDDVDAILTYMRSLRSQPFPVVSIADAHHHLFIDQPQAFIVELLAMLQNLQQSN